MAKQNKSRAVAIKTAEGVFIPVVIILSMEEGGIIQAEEEGVDEIFVYTGGEQAVPDGVRRVRVHRSVKIIPQMAFRFRHSRLIYYVELHDEIDIIERYAFDKCISLRRIKLLGVKVVEFRAFNNCTFLADVEFGNKLEVIEQWAFVHCNSLRSITMPSVRNIGAWAFSECEQLTDLGLPEALETVGEYAFAGCPSLRSIAMPLKDNMLEYGVFNGCPNLTSVALVGEIHKIIASLHLESWRNDMREEIDRINQILSNTPVWEKTVAIQRWIRSVIRLLEQYKSEHHALLKEATSLLELALWKANLYDKEGGIFQQEEVRSTRRQIKRARKELCITSGAIIVIKNVLPFLVLA
jgi:hypothetical protein